MKLIPVLTLLIAYCCSAKCAPIEIVYGGVADGSLDGIPFTEVQFTITAFGDTNDVEVVYPGLFLLDHSSANILLEGIGVATFLSTTRTYANNVIGGQVGFSRKESGGTTLYSVLAFARSWDISTTFQEVNPIASQIQRWRTSRSADDIHTTLGVLILQESIVLEGSFGATVVPIPGIAWLYLMSLTFLGYLSNRTAVR